MPSKAKEHSKTPSWLSNSNPLSVSPRTPSLATSLESQLCEDDFQTVLEEASAQYPSLIGKSAFIGRLTNVETEPRGCKIWLSESSMVSSSIAPGSTVSVSLFAPGTRFSNTIPFSSLADECVQQFGIDSSDQTANESRNYFALATVFPSCKVMKNGVQLLLNLSYTMGFPASGRVVFIYSLQNQLFISPVNSSDEAYNREVSRLSLHSCKELNLMVVPFKDRAKMNSDMFSTMNASLRKVMIDLEMGLFYLLKHLHISHSLDLRPLTK